MSKVKIPFKHNGIHDCDAAVLACIDFRFRDALLQFIKDHWEGIKHFDFPSIPGGVKALNEGSNLAWRCLSVPYELHNVNVMILVNHTDCGAYGGSSNFSTHEEEVAFHRDALLESKKKAEERFCTNPDKEVVVITILAEWRRDDNMIHFVIIE